MASFVAREAAAARMANLSAPEERWKPGSDVEAPAPRHDVRELLRGKREATLVLDGAAYRLRITASGKLILTK